MNGQRGDRSLSGRRDCQLGSGSEVASRVHVLEPEDLLVEVCTWEGTSIDVPGSAVAGTKHHFRMCFVYTVADGKVVRVECFDDAATGRRWNELMTHTKLLDLV